MTKLYFEDIKYIYNNHHDLVFILFMCLISIIVGYIIIADYINIIILNLRS